MCARTGATYEARLGPGGMESGVLEHWPVIHRLSEASRRLFSEQQSGSTPKVNSAYREKRSCHADQVMPSLEVSCCWSPLLWVEV